VPATLQVSVGLSLAILLKPIGTFALERLRDFCQQTFLCYPSDLAVFEPGAKHTFDAAAGKNIANPTAALLAAAKMLQVRMEIWDSLCSCSIVWCFLLIHAFGKPSSLSTRFATTRYFYLVVHCKFLELRDITSLGENPRGTKITKSATSEKPPEIIYAFRSK
jgi:hypothetical protein